VNGLAGNFQFRRAQRRSVRVAVDGGFSAPTTLELKNIE
jgi:hypothetical protein